jgi:hypothetical protein
MSSDQPGRYVKVPYVNAFRFKTTVEHYEVPPDYETNPAMHPYTSGIGPWPGPAPSGTFVAGSKPPSHYGR